jgi:uncharacterized protein (TIGR02246 family)
MANDVEKIKSTQRKWVKTCNSGDIDAWQNTFTNNFIWMPPDSPIAVGKKAVVASVREGFFDPYNIKLRATFNDVRVFGAQACTSGKFSIELTPKAGGKSVKASGKFMDLLAKQRDGSWKFARRIFNYDKPPA